QGTTSTAGGGRLFTRMYGSLAAGGDVGAGGGGSGQAAAAVEEAGAVRGSTPAAGGGAPGAGDSAKSAGMTYAILREEGQEVQQQGRRHEDRQEAHSDRHQHPRQHQRRRKHKVYEDEVSYDPYDASWSNVDWDEIRIPPPSSQGASGQSAPPQDGCVTLGRNGSRGSGASNGGTTADILSYDVKRVHDEATGRELLEIVPTGPGLAGTTVAAAAAEAGGDPAAAVLPAELLSACQEAAAEWAAEEQQRMEAAAEATPGLWRLEVAEALRELTGSEPLLRWVTPHNTAVADLLLLPPKQQPTRRGRATRGSASSPPPPVAVLLLGPEDVTRNAPYTPLGATRMRQRLLEAAGARVVVLPRFLWRLMSGAPEEQLCLLGNLLGGKM
ncbi:hypothetical protein Agub_g3139, partial [Astrephomene gubernaculifera]